MQKILAKPFLSSRTPNSANENEINQLRLEQIFGFTVQNNACVALVATSGLIAFPAGCVVVLYSGAKRSKQLFIHNTVKSPITALAFNTDGKLLATGESGKLPMVRIWNMETQSQIAEFSGHSYRVGSITFSPNSRFVVSIGSQEDMTINVWDISSSAKMATSRVTSKINAVAFSETGHFFVTVGVRHVRFWYLDNGRSKTKTTMALSGRNAILGDFMNNTFNDVGCCSLNREANSDNSQSYTYVISQAGQLMQFSEQRYLDKWVELQTPKATCLMVTEKYIMVGCSKGVILMFDTSSLDHVATLPMPHFLGIDIQTGKLDQGVHCDPVRYPDIIAGKYDHIHSRITCFYNDHSLYTWDVRDVRRSVKLSSHLFHSGGLWSVEPVPVAPTDGNGILDISSFITCSDDQTIRFWYLRDCRLALDNKQKEKLPPKWCNDRSKELLKIIYSDPCLKCLTESDRILVKNNHVANDANGSLKHGIRSIKISPDRQHLASADREGNLRFYSLVECKELYSIMAHNGEILSIDYFQSPSVPDLLLFCSSSRDRVIHVMDPGQQYKCIQTIVDHSGAIFSVKLVETPSDQEIRLVSCGMDKSLLFRILQPDESGQTAQFFLNQHLVGKQSQYDMVITPHCRYAAVACQDRQVRIYNLVTGKQRKSYRGCFGDDGNLLKCAIDPSGTYLATSGSDRCIHILNFTTGEILASVTGHSEIALGLCFLHDLKHLVSVSADNCIFVWRLPMAMTLSMDRRLKEMGSLNCLNIPDCDINESTAPQSTLDTVTSLTMSNSTRNESYNMDSCSAVSDDNAEIVSPSSFRFSVSALPSWAQRKFSRRDSVTFVQVNMMTDFCANMSTVFEKKEENNFFDDGPKKEIMISRRMSFIATEKVIRDDDSDNMDDDDSEWFSVEKNDCEAQTHLISTIQCLNTHEEEADDDDQDDSSLLTDRLPLETKLLDNTEVQQQHCKYVIKLNKDSPKNDTTVSTRTSWIDEKVGDSSIEEAQQIVIPDSIPIAATSPFLFEDTFATDEATSLGTKARRSFTTHYLSKTSAEVNIVNYPFKIDLGTVEKCIQRPTESSCRKINTPIMPIISTKTRQIKSTSEVNLSHVGAVNGQSESGPKSINNNQATGKVTFSRDEKCGSRDKKVTVKKLSERRGFNKSLSVISSSEIDDCVDLRQRSQTPSLTEKRTMSSNSARPKWNDIKNTRTVRKTCPVNILDIKEMHVRHPSTSNNILTNESLHNDGKVLSKVSVKTTEFVSGNVDKNIVSPGVLLFDFTLCNENEPNIEANLPQSLQRVSQSTSNTTTFEDMLNILTTQNQTGSKEIPSDGCEIINSADCKVTEICTDEWIDELFDNKSIEFLSSMTPKILGRLIDRSNLNTQYQRQEATRLLFEIEKAYLNLRSNLDLSPQSLSIEANASLIRDIGERIVDEVRRRMPESL